jgi:hypothetical protein
MASVSDDRTPPTLLSIPREIREQIFSYLLHPTAISVPIASESTRQLKSFDLRLLLTCSQIHDEALSVFRRQNIFVRISTPFAEAEHWVSIHGAVPIVRMKVNANKINIHHLHARIESPRFSQLRLQSANSFFVLLENLEQFTQHWFYTDVTNPGQNRHLRVTLEIKHPYAAEYDDDAIPKRLQRQLIYPFRLVKGLESFHLIGNRLPSIEKEIREAQAVPNKSAREILEETCKLKDEGNAAFKEKKWDEALQLYIEAFKVMYVICEGRQRSVWGDGSFQTYISGGQYDGQFAQQVRIVLRISLVANVIAVYLKLGQYDEARFWGMRTINMIRESMGKCISFGVPSL